MTQLLTLNQVDLSLFKSLCITNQLTVGLDVNTDRGDPNDPKVRLKRDCIGIMAAFRVPQALDNIFLLANTHIYW